MEALWSGLCFSHHRIYNCFLRHVPCHVNRHINRRCTTARLTTSSVSPKHTSRLPARGSLSSQQKLSALPILTAGSNNIYFYLQCFIGSAHRCYPVVCVRSTQFTKMTDRPSADFTVHVYSFHFMFWAHQNLKKKNRKQRMKVCFQKQSIKTNSNPTASDCHNGFLFLCSLYLLSFYICSSRRWNTVSVRATVGKYVAMTMYTSHSLHTAINPLANPWSGLHALSSLYSHSGLQMQYTTHPTLSNLTMSRSAPQFCLETDVIPFLKQRVALRLWWFTSKLDSAQPHGHWSWSNEWNTTSATSPCLFKDKRLQCFIYFFWLQLQVVRAKFHATYQLEQ